MGNQTMQKLFGCPASAFLAMSMLYATPTVAQETPEILQEEENEEEQDTQKQHSIPQPYNYSISHSRLILPTLKYPTSLNIELPKFSTDGHLTTSFSIKDFYKSNISWEWTKEDTQRQLAFTAAQLLDWKQTRHTVNNPCNFVEQNPFLGPHPTRSAVNNYFLITTFGNYFIARALPNPYRKYFQMYCIFEEINCTGNNINIGVKTRF